jgi:sulfur carrier protein
VQIKLNGKSSEIPDGTDLLGLLRLQGLPSELVAIELNEEMVPRARREGVALKDGDVVEILKMIAGGGHA